MAAEKLGLPTASICCEGFIEQGSATATALGFPNLPFSKYPGHINLDSLEEVQKKVETHLINQVIRCLTVQPQEIRPDGIPETKEPNMKDIIFKGSFEDVNSYFYRRNWSEGLPVVPPTIEKVNEFLKYTKQPPDRVLGVLLPDEREATIWNIAVNGVMAGCRPEYMPVLIAIVEVMADPKFGQQHLGHSPGTEVLITLNGPIINDLGFNYTQGALRVGFQANTSIGRFWTLYLRNVAGFLPHKTDKATFGGTWRVILAENEDALMRIGWQPMSVDQGFNVGENVITVSSCTSTDSFFSAGASSAEAILGRIAERIVDNQMILFRTNFGGLSAKPQIILSPNLAEIISKGGYTKKKAKQYLYEHAFFNAGRFEKLRPDLGSICDVVKSGNLPAIYCKSNDPSRLVPIVFSPEDFMITVSGDPNRDNCLICGQNGYIGYPTSKKIDLPENWGVLLKDAPKLT